MDNNFTNVDDVVSTNYNNIGNEKVLLDIPTVQQLQIITQFKQLRFECYKPSIGRRIDIATKDNAKGLAVLHYFLFHNISKAGACGSYKRLPNDNSLSTTDCLSWYEKLWGHTGDDYSRQMYEQLFFTWGYYHFMLGSENHAGNRWECDDYTNADKRGEWKYYFR